MWFIQYLHPELCMLYFCVHVMCFCLRVTSTCFRAFSTWGRVKPRVLWPAVLPGWPSMLAKRMSELRVGYISIQADMEWSWPWSCSSSRNFWKETTEYEFRTATRVHTHLEQWISMILSQFLMTPQIKRAGLCLHMIVRIMRISHL